MIIFDHLSKAYGELAAVRDLSLQVRAGEVYALLGANGAGKTTALRCLATLLQPTGGTASVDGHDIRTDPLGVRRNLGFLAASMGLYQRLTARELLLYFAALQQIPADRREAAVAQMVELFDLGPAAGRRLSRPV